MNLKCLLGVHRPLPISIARGDEGFVAICQGCARPLERPVNGKWTASPPLDAGAKLVA